MAGLLIASSPPVKERQATVLEAIALIFDKQRRMRRALAELGHQDPYIVEPKDYELQIARAQVGLAQTIGTREDPFVIMSQGRVIARYLILADGRFQISGSAEYVDLLEKIEAEELN